MAKQEQESVRQRQLREQEEAAQVGGVSSVDVANRAVKEGKTDPEFVVPGAGGQVVGEAEDDVRDPSNLVVRRTAGHEAADAAGRDLDADREAKQSPSVKVGDNDQHEAKVPEPKDTKGDSGK